MLVLDSKAGPIRSLAFTPCGQRLGLCIIKGFTQMSHHVFRSFAGQGGAMARETMRRAGAGVGEIGGDVLARMTDAGVATIEAQKPVIMLYRSVTLDRRNRRNRLALCRQSTLNRRWQPSFSKRSAAGHYCARA